MKLSHVIHLFIFRSHLTGWCIRCLLLPLGSQCWWTIINMVISNSSLTSI